VRLSTRQHRGDPEINLISLVDVVLLLLIFFMLTTSFVRQSQVAVRLPEASAVSPAEQTPAPGLDITVTARGVYYVNGRALVDSRPETLAAAIRGVAPEGSARDVSISADAQATHQAVITAMDVVGRLGYTDVHIATIRPRRDAE
jgi:biopolymer transport protein ExbD